MGRPAYRTLLRNDTMNELAFTAENACVDADALTARISGLAAIARDERPDLADQVANAMDMAKRLERALANIANAVARPAPAPQPTPQPKVYRGLRPALYGNEIG